MRFASLATLGILFCGAGAFGQDLSLCSTSQADLATTTTQLRDIKDACDLYSDGYARALYRLNTFPLPENVPRLALRPQVADVPVNRVILETDVFFSWLEAYPIDVGLSKLAELVSRINTGFHVEQIQITATADPTESELPSLQIASRRAEFVRKYFVASGIDSARITALKREPTHENTAEGRARDRSVALRVVILRQLSEPVR